MLETRLGIRYRFKNDAFSTVAGSRDNSSTAYQPRSEIIHDVPVQIRHYHYVKLMRIGYHLHGTIVDNHRLKRDPVLRRRVSKYKICF